MKTAVVRLVSTLAFAMTVSVLSMQNSVANDTNVAATGAASKRVVQYKTLQISPIAQRYEIEIFDNGDVVYTGLGNVNRLGIIKWRVSPDQVDALVRKIWPQFTPPTAREPPDAESRKPNGGDGHIPPAAVDSGTNRDPESRRIAAKLRLWYLEIAHQGEVRILSQGIGDPPFDKWLRESLEQVIPTKSIRCPFLLTEERRLGPRRVLPIGADVCEYVEEVDRFTSNFNLK